MKQKEYRETYSLAQNAPYQIGDDAYKEHHGVAAQWFCFGLRPEGCSGWDHDRHVREVLTYKRH